MAIQGAKTTEAEVLQHAANITELMQTEGITLTAAIAKLGLNKMSVLTNWPKLYPSFATAIERARDLRQEYLEQHFLKFVRGEAKGSPAAAIFALVNCNRASGDWKQSTYIETKQTTENNFDLAKLNDEELLQLQKLLDKQTGVIQIEARPTPVNGTITSGDRSESLQEV